MSNEPNENAPKKRWLSTSRILAILAGGGLALVCTFVAIVLPQRNAFPDVSREVFDAAKAEIEGRTGLPSSGVLAAATHTHAAVRAVHIGTGPLDDAYHDRLAAAIAEAVVKAVANLAPANR